ncbi:MAG: prepilin-type N-terminal cleavage/methylation domain-containing protein [Merdibacter sp.]
MHDKNAGFTMVEMCLVLAIVTILLAVFSLPGRYTTQTLHISMLRLQSFIETVQSEAVAQSGAHRAHTGNQAISEQRQLQLPASVSCEGRSCTFIHSTHPHRQRRSAVRMAVGSRW